VPPTDPSSTTTTLAPLALAGTGVRGTVTESPTCPGAVRPGQNCTAPVSVRIDAHDSTGAVAGSTTSLDDGRYALALPPGSYTLVVDTAQSGPFSCPSTDVTITDGAPASADIDCDTGIR
jgi:hypothetical protein